MTERLSDERLDEIADIVQDAEASVGSQFGIRGGRMLIKAAAELLAEVLASRSLPLPAEVAGLVDDATTSVSLWDVGFIDEDAERAAGDRLAEHIRTLTDTCSVLARRVQELEAEREGILQRELELRQSKEAIEKRWGLALKLPAASVEQLRTALRPFAALADEIEACAAQYSGPAASPENWAKSCSWEDLLRARAALAASDTAAADGGEQK